MPRSNPTAQRSTPARVVAATGARRGRNRPLSAFGTITSALKRAFSMSDALGSSCATAPAARPRSAQLPPGSEGVLDALERGRKLRVMANQHVPHRVPLDPVDALGR